LIIKGKKEAGIKMLSNALMLIGCMNAEKGKQIRKYAVENPAEAFKIVRAHAEILNLVEALINFTNKITRAR
jgi:uncharacterized protein YgbK (DUF1537 family)